MLALFIDACPAENWAAIFLILVAEHDAPASRAVEVAQAKVGREERSRECALAQRLMNERRAGLAGIVVRWQAENAAVAEAHARRGAKRHALSKSQLRTARIAECKHVAVIIAARDARVIWNMKGGVEISGCTRTLRYVEMATRSAVYCPRSIRCTASFWQPEQIRARIIKTRMISILCNWRMFGLPKTT